MLNLIARELYNNQKRVDQVIEHYRRNNRDAGMRPKEFSSALKKEVPGLADKLTTAKLTLMVHYLA